MSEPTPVQLEPTRVQLEAFSAALREGDDAAAAQLLHKLGVPTGLPFVHLLRDRLAASTEEVAETAPNGYPM